MKSREDVIRPIKIFGAILVALAFLGAYFFTYLDLTASQSTFRPNSPSYFGKFGFYFIAGVNIFYLLTGVGVVLLTKWGYFCFKLFLYMMLVAFPIGTLISYVTLSYMKRHQIKRHFGFEMPQAS